MSSASAILGHRVCVHSAATQFLQFMVKAIYTSPLWYVTWWEVISGARLGQILPLLTSGTARYQSLLLDPDHLEWVTVSPLSSILASLIWK